MSDQRYSPPEPRFAPKADAPEPAEQASRARVWSPLTIALTSVSALVVVGLVITLAMLWGKPTEPVAGEPAPSWRPDGGSSAGPTDTPSPTPTPHVVKPGETITIDQDAVFEDGFTLKYPSVSSGWNEHEIVNRPEQLTLYSNDYSQQLQVWQTSVFDSNQTDEELTRAQLNRLPDECGYGVSNVSEPESYLLEGNEDIKLELLLVKGEQCDGGEIWMLQRVMPLTGTRVHIVLWSTTPIDDADALLDKFEEITFTTP